MRKRKVKKEKKLPPEAVNKSYRKKKVRITVTDSQKSLAVDADG